LLSRRSSPEATARGQSFGSGPQRLSLDAIDPALVESGQPVARGTTLSRSPDGRLSSGLWECSAGAFQWTFWVDEIIFILDGEATIREDSGAIHVLRQGDVAHFPRGLHVRWEIPGHVRKFFVVRMPGGTSRLARWAAQLRTAVARCVHAF
jgi:uncharacterized cupin superfamily protein